MFLGCQVEERGTVKVFVYRRVSVNNHSRRIRFNEMVASEPVFDFWELRSSNDTIDGTSLRRGRVDRLSPGRLSTVV